MIKSAYFRPGPGSLQRSSIFVLVVFAIVFISLEVFSLRQKSATWDESIHLAAGYVAVAKNDYRIDPTHPPFLRIWAALPLLAMRVAADTSEIDRTPIGEWLIKAYAFAHRFLYIHHDADRLLYAARFMVVIWGVVLGILVYCWAREWLGPTAAIVALGFYTIEPNIAAHATLVTTDLAITCFIFATVYFLWRTLRRRTGWNLAALTISFSLAIVTKFSGILLVPIVLVLLAAAVVLRTGIRVKESAWIVALLAAGAFLTVWAVYGFRYAPSESSAWLLRAEDFQVVRERIPITAGILGWVDAHHLLPNVFTQGFLFGQASAETFPAYFAGAISKTSLWYYFPAAFLLKTPEVLIAFFIAGLILFVRRRRELGPTNEVFVALPILIYLGFAIASGVNIGVRHILPIYPFVLLIASAFAKQLIESRRAIGKYVLAGLMALWIGMFAHVYPHTLTFFNVVAGGPANGLSWLAESNVDWGQDLKLLKSWMDRKNASHINLAYFGTADPAYYKINCTHLPGAPFFAGDLITKPVLPGYVAISKTLQSGLYLTPEWVLFYSGLQNQTPVDEIGNSISVYWVEDWPEGAQTQNVGIRSTLADALNFGLGWPDHAIVHYRAILDHQPDDFATIAKLGTALLQTGKNEEGIPMVRRAADIDPTNAQLRSRLAAALLDIRQLEEARTHAEAAVELTPNDPFSHDILGVALVGAGKLEAAEASFERALELAPAYETAREHLRRLRDWRRK